MKSTLRYRNTQEMFVIHEAIKHCRALPYALRYVQYEHDTENAKTNVGQPHTHFTQKNTLSLIIQP
jgi:hypothetical protein